MTHILHCNFYLGLCNQFEQIQQVSAVTNVERNNRTIQELAIKFNEPRNMNSIDKTCASVEGKIIHSTHPVCWLATETAIGVL